MTKRPPKPAADTPKRRGRPPMSTQGRRRMLVVSLPPETDDELRALAEAEQRPVSWLVRELLRLGMTRYQPKVP